ncbi:MAG: radical SAM protein, partial [Candidatus Aureabacteria bacterium]|nr:radical SAM protein [Candidatus Auribacterota bacterium]
MKYLYGPVISRRLGLSLGVDLIPLKTCSFNCIYCQLSYTASCVTKRKDYVSPEAVIDEFLKFNRENINYDWITFSGSGEPTLNASLGYIIKEIKRSASKKICVITNSSLINSAEVRQDLLGADLVMPSLDAVSPDIFRKINRPSEGADVGKIIDGLVKFRKEFMGQVWLEIMLVRGINDSDAEITKFSEAIKRIKPDKVHLNTVVRPPSEKNALPVDRYTLIKIAGQLGDKADVIGNLPEVPQFEKGRLDAENLLGLLESHPATVEEIMNSFGATKF